jgi:uncharacterized protein with HEPN domain
MLPEDRIRIQHMVDASYDAIHFVNGLELGDVEGNRLLLLALVKCVEILGEAASRVSVELRQQTPQIPWRQIIAMRNRLIHGYYDIDVEIVWRTVREEIPLLIPPLEQLLVLK